MSTVAIRRHRLLTMLSWVMVLGCLACSSPSETVTSSTGRILEPPAPSAQVLLLTQPFAYDNTRKDSVAGAYAAQASLEVPADLAPQNKWVMFEGPVLENDLVAYRFYLDRRHRYDIYGKRVADLVMDTVSWDYHDVMDWGSDILKVGNSLGAGTPALHRDGKLYHLGEADAMRVEVGTDERGCAKVETVFTSLHLDGDKVHYVSETLTLCPGSQDLRVQLRASDGGLPRGFGFCAGIVNHQTDARILNSRDQTALYTWGDQSFHGDKLGMALVSSRVDRVSTSSDSLNHLLLFEPGDHEVSYTMLSGWELGVEPFATEAEFQKLVRQKLGLQ